jgi:hypothetical protein
VCGRRGDGDRRTLAVTAMFPVHAHWLEQPWPARTGRPHCHRRHRVALLVVPDQTLGVGVGQSGHAVRWCISWARAEIRSPRTGQATLGLPAYLVCT